jgi:hypothetical protein
MDMKFIGIIILLPLAIMFIAGLVMLIVSKRSKITGLILMVLPVVLFVLLFLLFSAHKVPVAEQNFLYPQTQPSRFNIVDNLQILSTSPIWEDAVEQEFEADIYPSKTATVKALAHRLAKSIEKIPQYKNAKRIIIYDQENMDLLVEGLKQVLDDQLVPTPVTIEESMWKKMPDAITVRIRLLVKGEIPTVGNYSAESGKLSLDIFWPDGNNKTISAKFVEKEWIDNYSKFISQNPDKNWIVSRSQSSCISQDQANNEALADAVRQLSVIITGYQKQNKRSGMISLKTNVMDIMNNDMIVDKFVQSFDGSSSQIWRQALLIDASPEKLSKLLKKKLVESTAMRRTWARTLFSAIGCILLICIVYGFLNLATRGYYTIALRIVTIALIVILIVILILFTT